MSQRDDEYCPFKSRHCFCCLPNCRHSFEKWEPIMQPCIRKNAKRYLVNMQSVSVYIAQHIAIINEFAE
jgi:hypothetical protein